MKKRVTTLILKAFGIVMGILGLLCLFTYLFIWNPHVDLSINTPVSFPLTVEQRLEDFDYLYDTLSDSFPYFEVKKRQFGYDWSANREEFKKRISSAENDLEFYYMLQECLFLIQNGHTNIISPGEEFDDYIQLYAGPTPWGQVFENRNVNDRYEYWDTIVPERNTSIIPVAFEYIEGGYYASRNLINPEGSTEEFGVALGSKLIKVDGTDIDTYIGNLKNKKILKVDSKRDKLKVSVLSINSDKSVGLTLILPSGEEVNKVIEPQNPDPLSNEVKTRPINLYSTKIIDKDKIAYLKLPSLAASYVEKDRAGIRSFLEQVKDYPALIIDIRGNGGGSTNYWMANIVPLLINEPLQTENYILFKNSHYIKPFIKHKMFYGYFTMKSLDKLSFAKENPAMYLNSIEGKFTSFDYVVRPNNPVGFKGKIYMLVDDKVYSSAEAFAAFAKATGWAQLIGTRTGGDGIGFDPVPMVLPNSGLIVRFPAEMGLNPDRSVNDEVATEPDIFIEKSCEDFLKGLSTNDTIESDTILKAAIEQIIK